MTEKTVEQVVKIRPDVTVLLKTGDGVGKIRFQRLKKNHVTKLQIDLGKDYNLGIDSLLKTVNFVEGLSEYGTPVTLEDIHAGDVSPELAGAIFESYIKVLNAGNEASEPEKKLIGEIESAPD